jgi:glycosyltransferase involved in cell wall biosynthesis
MPSTKPNLRVLHILGELRPSGAECMLKVAAKVFASHGIDSEVLSTGSTDIGTYAPSMKNAGYVVHHIPFAKSLSFFFSVYSLIRARHYDAIHIHSERANFWLGLTAKIAGTPRIVSTVHGAFAFRGWLRTRRMIMRRLLEQLGVVRVAIGKSVQEIEWKHFRSAIDIVPNWYDSDRFRPPTFLERMAARNQLGIDLTKFVIVSVGNCSDIKNHQASLPENLRIVYVHVGAEDSGVPERKLAEQLGIGDRVYFLGQLDNTLPALYAADAYTMPSLHEGFGIAALEALAVGLPAILADVLGLCDFRNYFPNLIYVAPRADSLASAFAELAKSNSEHRREITRDYPRICREGFGMEVGVAKYADLYRP